MRKNIVITLTGHDRIGIVDHVTELVLECSGNVESSKMARLGGEFAMLMMISVPVDNLSELNKKIQILSTEGFQVITSHTDAGDSSKYVGWLPYQVKIIGADHEGIVHHIAHRLAEHGINIETMDTSMNKAPMSGTPLFMMTAIVIVPPELHSHNWQDDLEAVGDELNVDIEIYAYTG